LPVAELGDVHAGYGSVFRLREEREIDDPDDAAIYEIDEHRQALSGHLVSGELDNEVVDRAHFSLVVAHGCPHSLRGCDLRLRAAQRSSHSQIRTIRLALACALTPPGWYRCPQPGGALAAM